MTAWDIFYNNVSQNYIVRSKDKIVLAVSGGVDSICMLHLFWRLGKKINIDLLVTNFNHKLRKESFKEAKLVKDFSDKLGIVCLLETIDVKEYSQKESVSIETAGRKLRYLILEKIAQKNKCNKIATAHNANDNAETVFMWLLRGSGDCIGIPGIRKTKKNLDVIRPLLPVKRELIEAYVKKHNLPFCNDQSNFLNIYTRNKIRNLLMPICTEINPMAIEHIYSLSCIRTREDTYLQHIVNKCLKKCVEIKKDKVLLDLAVFLRYNEAVRFRIIKNIFPHKKYNSHINLIMRKILSADRSVYSLSADWFFEIKADKACFVKRSTRN
ncbi:MAG: tRNA lysidine(34) synthetase TilS [Endomicrobium sp.]|jgi:tRNA(Ile)-lysidine synthase|nr:tRNA lysidine(34) synthetase TilS [Endomicrobium sp.]